MYVHVHDVGAPTCKTFHMLQVWSLPVHAMHMFPARVPVAIRVQSIPVGSYTYMYMYYVLPVFSGYGVRSTEYE